MRIRIIGATMLCLVAACGIAGKQAGTTHADTSTPTPPKALKAFSGEAELNQLLAGWQTKAKQLQREREQAYKNAPPLPAPAPAPMAIAEPVAIAADAAASTADAVASTGSEESITNVQTAGVDEGGIVKRHGDHLVVLRRGRLFTVKIGDDSLQPVSRINAFPPQTDGSGDWYDEMLIAGDTVAVIGYSYARGGTELGLFDIGHDGKLSYRATYHLRSNDYYSVNNYASRLIGNKLIFYTPMRLNAWSQSPLDHFPGYRRWQPQAKPADFKRILPATRIYRTNDELDPFEDDVSLHTVTTCDLAQRELQCESTAVMGPSGRVFYVSQDSVFVWTTRYAHGENQKSESAVFRIPLQGHAPTALKTSGGPLDQMSFLHGSDGYLNVLLSADSNGEGMWAARSVKRGDMALLRVPLNSFGDGSAAAPASAYRSVPSAGGYGAQNRFIGDWLVYGSPNHHGWGRDAAASGQAYALRYAQTAPVQEVPLRHGVERIEAMGNDAVLAGNAGSDLLFSSLRLGPQAELASVYARPNARQGESRTHGFFYKPTAAAQGMVGLPIVQGEGGAAVTYLRNDNLQLRGMGQLDARSQNDRDDGCMASCVDWYGNARPIFMGDRVFALMGYELVEGRVAGQRIGERRRIDFSPPAAVQTIAQ